MCTGCPTKHDRWWIVKKNVHILFAVIFVKKLLLKYILLWNQFVILFIRKQLNKYGRIHLQLFTNCIIYITIISQGDLCNCALCLGFSNFDENTSKLANTFDEFLSSLSQIFRKFRTTKISSETLQLCYSFGLKSKLKI